MLNQGELHQNEVGRLIGSDKVEGTSVYGADRNKIGSIERVMIDKVSGKVSYAVLGFGGFLGPRQRPLSAAVAVAEIRHGAWRLRHRHYHQGAGRRAEIRRTE
ncbi:hypothetical protein ACVWWR_005504 [Bradyrhizobium sp. LM3.2]